MTNPSAILYSMKFGEKRGEGIRMDTYNMIDFNEKKGFICDMDGVI